MEPFARHSFRVLALTGLPKAKGCLRGGIGERCLGHSFSEWRSAMLHIPGNCSSGPRETVTEMILERRNMIFKLRRDIFGDSGFSTGLDATRKSRTPRPWLMSDSTISAPTDEVSVRPLNIKTLRIDLILRHLRFCVFDLAIRSSWQAVLRRPVGRRHPLTLRIVVFCRLQFARR